VNLPCTSGDKAGCHAPVVMIFNFYRIAMKKLNSAVLALLSVAFVSTASIAAPEKTRQEAVAERGLDVMPFDLKATTHIFTKTASGGVQQVVAKNADDVRQINLIDEHLNEIARQFSQGDFSGPTHIHGEDMPGLAELKAAKPSEIKVQYRKIKAGAEIIYATRNPRLIAALHEWFDAQLSDHGTDAMAGHDHSRMHQR